jgi:hypothetical protein
MHMMQRLSREELYNSVWRELASTPAPRFGISEAKLKNACALLSFRYLAAFKCLHWFAKLWTRFVALRNKVIPWANGGPSAADQTS